MRVCCRNQRMLLGLVAAWSISTMILMFSYTTLYEGEDNDPRPSTLDKQVGDIYHMVSVACGEHCGIKGKNDVGALIRSMIAFGKPRAEQQQLHYHLVLSSESFANCTQRILDEVSGWMDQDESVESWFRLEFHDKDELVRTLQPPLDDFDEYLINGYRSCSGFRIFLLDLEPFSEIEKMVYVDIDVMMFNSVTRIAEEWASTWAGDQSLGVIGSAGDLFPPKHTVDYSKGAFGVSMNAGVLFMELQKMRSFDFRMTIKKLVQEGRAAGYKYQSGDQGQLNHFCAEYPHRCRPTDCGWNLVNGNNATHCSKEHRDAKHTVLLHRNWGMHSDYTDLLRKENQLQWVRDVYANNVSQCQVERFEMSPQNQWVHCFPKAWRGNTGEWPNRTIGCPPNAWDVNIC